MTHIPALRMLLKYNCETGVITSDFCTQKLRADGYVSLYFPCWKLNLQSHRVAFAIHHGYWPTIVDHENRIRCDNRLKNLIESDHKRNSANKTKRGLGPYSEAKAQAEKNRHLMKIQMAVFNAPARERQQNLKRQHDPITGKFVPLSRR